MGTLLAGAVGDALGAPFEGLGPDPDRVLPLGGTCTDDTALTLATCEAITRAGGPDLERIAGRYAEWFRLGRPRSRCEHPEGTP